MATGPQSTAHILRPNLGGISQLANLYLTSSRTVQGFETRSCEPRRGTEWPKNLLVSA